MAAGGEQAYAEEDSHWTPSLSDAVTSITVRFQGLQRISPHTLIQECLPLRQPRTLGEVSAAVQQSQANLEELGVLKRSDADVTVNQDGTVSVVFVVEERRHQLTAGANIDKKGEVTCDLSGTKPAVMRGAASAKLQVSTTVSQTHEFLLRLTSARLLGQRLFWSLDASKATIDERTGSSYVEQVSRVSGTLRDSSGRHMLCAEAALRDLVPSSIPGRRLPSTEIQQAALQSFKTCLRYSYVRSWKPIFSGLAADFLPYGSTTFSARCGVEAALPPGEAKFLRYEAQGWASTRLPLGLVGSIGAAAGYFLPMTGQASFLQDRFHLGGATGTMSMFKGFADRGTGPMAPCIGRDPQQRADRATDALGGEAMLAVHARISTPVDLESVSGMESHSAVKDAGLRLFFFGGLGMLAQHSSVWPTRLATQLCAGTRAAVGVGLSLPVGALGDVEVSCAWPFHRQAADVLQHWQVGLRINIMG